MTKIEMFAALRSIVTDNAALSDENRAELVEKIDHEMALLTKKAMTPSKPTGRQVENTVLRAELVEILNETKRAMTIDELVASVNRSAYSEDVTNGRVSALLTNLKTAGKVIRTEGPKRKAMFSIAPEA